MFTCSVCNRSFNTQKGLKHHTTLLHQETITNTSDRNSLTCTQCKKTFCNKGNLMRHIREKFCRATTPSTSSSQISVVPTSSQISTINAVNATHVATNMTINNVNNIANDNSVHVTFYVNVDQLLPITKSSVTEMMTSVFQTDEVIKNPHDLVKKFQKKLEPSVIATDVPRMITLWKNGENGNAVVRDHKSKLLLKQFPEFYNNTQIDVYCENLKSQIHEICEQTKCKIDAGTNTQQDNDKMHEVKAAYKFIKEFQSNNQTQMLEVGKQISKTALPKMSLVAHEQFSTLREHLLKGVKDNWDTLYLCSAYSAAKILCELFSSYDSELWVSSNELHIKNDSNTRVIYTLDSCLDMLRMIYDSVFGKKFDTNLVNLMLHTMHKNVDHERLITAENDLQGPLKKQAFTNFKRWQQWFQYSPESSTHHQNFQLYLKQFLSTINIPLLSE
jgi:hypothetical protein